MPTYNVKCNQCGKVKEIRPPHVVEEGETCGVCECGGQYIKQGVYEVKARGLSTPGRQD